MKKSIFTGILAVAGIGWCAAVSAGGPGGLTANRITDGVVLSFLPGSGDDIRCLIDTDSNTETGLKTGEMGADYKYEGGKLHIYIGDGKSQEWEALDNKIVRGERKGRAIVFFKNSDLELSPKKPVKMAVFADGNKLKDFRLPMPTAGKARAPYKRFGKRFEYLDPAGDVPPTCRIDFIKMFVMPHPKKANTLMFGFTSDFPIERKKLSYHLRLMFRVGEGMGANVGGETFNYMFESPNRLFRYIGTTPHQWKWELVGKVPARFQQQWCEIDIPLESFKLDEMPESFKFRLGCEHNDYVPDLRYAAPEYRVKK